MAGRLIGILYIVVLVAYSIAGAVETETHRTFGENSEYIFAVQLKDGTHLADALTTYQFLNVWYLPLGELSQVLGFNITVSESLGTASGYILKEQDEFQLDTKKCTYATPVANGPYDCRDVAFYSGDLWVPVDLVQRFLPVQLSVQSLKSLLVIDSKLQLPIQQKAERERMQLQLGQMRGAVDYGYPLVEPTGAKNRFHSFDHQIRYYDKSLNGHRTENGTSQAALATGRLFGLEALGYIGTTKSEIDSSRLTLSRSTPEDKHLFNLISYKKLELIDTTLTSIPLISNGGAGQGFLISSYPINQPTQFDVHDFVGPLSPDWEVELYQNNLLIGRDQGEGGQYHFKSIPLLYGENRFRFVFYGPTGQVREEYQTLRVDPSSQPAGVGHYEVGVITEKDGRKKTQAHTDVGLSKTLSARLAYSDLTLKERREHHQYLEAAAIGSFFRSLYQVGHISDVAQSGRASYISVRAPLWSTDVGLHYRLFDGFRSEMINKTATLLIDQQIEGTWNISLPVFTGLRTTISYLKDRYEDDTFSESIRNQLLLQTYPIFWMNTFEQKLDTKDFNGEFTATHTLNRLQSQFGSQYSQAGLNSLSVQESINFQRRTSLNAGLRYFLHSDRTDFITGASHNLGLFTVSVSSFVNGDGGYGGEAQLNYNLTRDGDGGLHLSGDSLAEKGVVLARVYSDLNQNNHYDPGEPVRPSVGVYYHQAGKAFTTDEQGVAYIPNLSLAVPADLSIDMKTLEDPSDRSMAKGFRVVPERGNTYELDFPIIKTAEISGVVSQLKEKGKYLAVLTDTNGKEIARERVEADGFFIIEQIFPGKYQLQIKDQAGNQIGTWPDLRPVVVDQTKGEIVSQNFQIINER